MMANIFNNLKNFQFKKLIYPAISAFFIVVAVVTFVWITRFLYRSINKALTPNKQSVESQLIKVDLDGFYLVIKKLGINLDKEVSELKSESPEKPAESQDTTETNSSN